MSTIKGVIRRRSGPPIIDDLGKTWVATGSAVITTALSKFGTGCLDISSASGDSITTTSGMTDYQLPSNTAFCFDFWLYVPTLSAGVIFTGEGTNAVGLKMNASGALTPLEFGVGDYYTTSNALVANTWQYIAFFRNASNVSNVCVNGSVVGSGSMPSSFGTPSVFNIGAYSAGGAENAACFVDDFRYAKGNARYTGAHSSPVSEATADTGVVSLLRFNA